MKRVKTLLGYGVWIILFFIFSEFLINVSLSSNYKPMSRIDNTKQVVINQAQSTAVNGKILGFLNVDNEMVGKYIEVELYSKNDVFMGRRYIQIENSEKNIQPINLNFKVNNVKSYKIEIVDSKKGNDEIEIIPKEMTKPEIWLATALAFLIFW